MIIKIGNRKIKLFNWIIFLTVVGLIIYFLISLIFMLPIFNNKYNYDINKTNYKISANVKFKHAWFNCNVKEVYNISSNDNLVKERLISDLKEEGFKGNDKKLVRKYKNFGLCSDDIKEYKKEHNDYVLFKLNGKDTVKLNYKDEYKDPYVTLKINGKSKKNINIYSNYNENKVGEYITSYSVKVSKYYTDRLYRKIIIEDKEKPEIILEGEDVVLDYRQDYVEAGYKAIDNYDGNITSKVKVTNNVNSRKAGLYKVSYTVTDSNNNKIKVTRNVEVKENSNSVSKQDVNIQVKDGITYVDGIILVNKKYSLPKDYDPKVNKEAYNALKELQSDAKAAGFSLPLASGYRSYKTQEELYNKYVKKDGVEKASMYSAKPGHSEHQTGLAFDVGVVDSSFANTPDAKWLAQNCHLYGFIIRYPKDKTDITGYIYEPWHIRYLGKDIAKKVKESGLTLEEYLGVN